jgi:hypothetical protein
MQEESPMEETGEKSCTDPWEKLTKKLKESKRARVAPVDGGQVGPSTGKEAEDLVRQCLKTLEDLEKTLDGGCEDLVHHVSQEDGAEMWGCTNQEHDEQAWLQEGFETCDARTGDVLDPLVVREVEELVYMRSIGLHTKLRLVSVGRGPAEHPSPQSGWTSTRAALRTLTSDAGWSLVTSR